MPNQHVKTRLAQIEVRAGDPRANTNTMLTAIASAVSDHIELLIFPEMVIPGYLIGDRWEQPAFLRQCEACGETIRQASDRLTLIFGNVAVDWKRQNEDGRPRKYNALFVADHGKFIGPEGSPYPYCIKTLLPNYRQFDDSRHFHDLRKLAFEQNEDIDRFFTPIRSSCATLGCILCEDAWNIDYALSPLERLSRHDDIELFVNASASPFTFNKNHKRNRVFAAHARHVRRPLVYVNHTGIQNNGKTIFTFDGSSCVYDALGHAIRCTPAFEANTLTVDIPRQRDTAFAPMNQPQEDAIAELSTALRYGLRHFLSHCGIERVVIGASGGIDSAVVAALIRCVLPPENILLANMPGRYNSRTTRDLAAELARNLKVPYVSLPIEDSVALTCNQINGLQPMLADGPPPQPLQLSAFMLENVQARDRSSRILAALASAFGGGFTCNANKSEMTVGYSTLYGDLSGFIAPIADLWKGEVYALANDLNDTVYQREVIPRGTLTIVPSAELSDAQNVDQGQGDPLIYPYHDRLFASWVEWWNRATPEEILDWYAKGELETHLKLDSPITTFFPDANRFINDLERWWNLYQGMGLAKRIQAPPVLAVKRRAFGFDHREAQLGTHYTDDYRALKARLLQV